MRNIVSFVVACFLGLGLWVSTPAQAENVDLAISPMPMLQQATDQMLAELKTMAVKKDQDKKYLKGIVKNLLLPKVDQKAMARSVVGRSHWVKATIEQQEAFTREFMQMIIHIYADALAAYDDQKVRFLPVRQNDRSRQVQVKSLIEHAHGPTIEVTYSVVRKHDGWRVTDFSVDGISMVQSYRSQFSQVLADKGISGLLERVKDHNQRQSS